MANKLRFKIYKEALWWIFSLIAALMVIIPIYTLKGQYPYLIVVNALAVVLLINCFRYVVFFKNSPLSNIRWLKKLFVFLNIGIAMYMLNRFQYINILLEEITPSTFHKLGSVLFSDIQSFFYLEKEIIFFMIGTLVCLFILEIRLVRSIWKQDFAEEI